MLCWISAFAECRARATDTYFEAVCIACVFLSVGWLRLLVFSFRLVKSSIRLTFEYITFQVHQNEETQILCTQTIERIAEREKKVCNFYVLISFDWIVLLTWVEGAIQTVNHTHTKISIGVGGSFVFAIFDVPLLCLFFLSVSRRIHTASCSAKFEVDTLVV